MQRFWILAAIAVCSCRNSDDDGNAASVTEASQSTTVASESGATQATSSATAGSATAGSDTSSVAESETCAADQANGSKLDTGMSCDIFAQDCPPFDKCIPGWDRKTSVCVPIMGEDVPGESCSLTVHYSDTCGAGSVCSFPQPSEDECLPDEGICVELCSGSASAPSCSDDRVCWLSTTSELALCLRACDPFAPECADGEACYAFDDGNTYCAPDHSDGAGAVGEGCRSLNSCSPGLFCSEMACGGFPCCVKYCDVEAPSCALNQTCVPIHEGAAVGGCTASSPR